MQQKLTGSNNGHDKEDQNPGGSMTTDRSGKPRSNSLSRLQGGGKVGRRTMEAGSDEHNAGLEAMGKKKGITPSGSVANLQKMEQSNLLRNTEAVGRGNGVYQEVPGK